jgi:hypothetical protein
VFSSDYRPTETTTTKTMPCCMEEAKLVIPVRDGLKLHERECPKCGMAWTFASEARIIPPDELPEGKEFAWEYSVLFYEGRPESEPTAAELSRENAWLADFPQVIRDKHFEIKERRRAEQSA